jgi:molybdate transport system ATP-binding protein
MIEVRLKKNYVAGNESAGFSLEVEFQVPAGITVLFGPSGAGKSLTLDCVAGFAKPDCGHVILDGQPLFDSETGINLPPQKRHCGYVFQNYALFPHMTLRENLAFAAATLSKKIRRQRVDGVLERFRLEEVAGRYPHQVSGGQKQRCSLARALVGQSRMLLLDEPARGLDAALQWELHSLLRELRTEYQIPMILVTHNLEECFAVGKNMLVYGHGRILQSGKPREILEHPATPEIARILGYTNVFQAEILAINTQQNTTQFRLFGQEVTGRSSPQHAVGKSVWICMSPEDIQLCSSPGKNRIPVQLLHQWEQPQSIKLEFSNGILVETKPSTLQALQNSRNWFVELPHALRTIG